MSAGDPCPEISGSHSFGILSKKRHENFVVETMGLRLKFSTCYLLAVCPWESYLGTLRLRLIFLIFKMVMKWHLALCLTQGKWPISIKVSFLQNQRF